ncbi:unnamed protein product [Symbiodinium natans]|uniref:protein-ribulosamine 3-kinase n=1 Tax=Symbiodinium natans TaxID=878477 RepID=A0A812JEW0_9DINO|nr:unnamed protein product [Symbiodinium natans]
MAPLLKRVRKLLPLWKQVLRSTRNLEALFADGEVKPSLLHGDLWNGNMAGSPMGQPPALFDPAAYFGHSEAEFGMAWCADFDEKFWQGYRSIMPEAPGFRKRQPLYEAYHKLNHYCLFQESRYLSSAEALLKKLL